MELAVEGLEGFQVGTELVQDGLEGGLWQLIRACWIDMKNLLP